MLECASGASGFPPLCREVGFHCLDGLLAQSPIGGHVGCFRFLDIVSSAAVNTDAHTSALLPAHESFGHIPRSGIAGPHGNSIFHFLRTPIVLFSTAAAPSYVPPAVPQLSHLSFPALCCHCSVLGSSRPHRCKAVCHWVRTAF